MLICKKNFSTLIELKYSPNVFILECFHNNRIFLAIEPKLTKCFYSGCNSINHAQDTHSWPDAWILSNVIISAEQLESSICRLKCLPVNVTELKIKNWWIWCTLFIVIFAIRLRLNGFVLRPISDRKWGQFFFNIFH